MSSSEPNGKITCPYCSQTFPDGDTFSLHWSSKHPDKLDDLTILSTPAWQAIVQSSFNRVAPWAREYGQGFVDLYQAIWPLCR